MTRPRVVAIIAVAMLAGPGWASAAPGPASAATTKRCLRHGETVLRRSAQMELVTRDPYARQGTVRGNLTFLCRYSNKQRIALGVGGDQITLRTLRINGLYAAFEDGYSDGGPDDSTTLIERSFIKGNAERVIDIGATTQTVGVHGPFRAIVLRASGSVAYIRSGNTGPAGVFRCDRACKTYTQSRPETLSDATDLDLDSLRSTHTGIRWIQGGVTRTARLR